MTVHAAHALAFTVRTADAETAEIHAAPERPLRAILQEVLGKTPFTIASNQIPFFRFEGKDYEDLDQPLSVIAGLETGDELALLVRPRAG